MSKPVPTGSATTSTFATHFARYLDEARNARQQLATLSREAYTVVASRDIGAGGVVAARKQARMATRPLIQQIDAIAQRLLGLAPASPDASIPDDEGQDIAADEEVG